MKVMLDSFSGAIADLPPRLRTPENALAVLAKHPRVSTWDMSETSWLQRLITNLKGEGLIAAVETEPYPWHRYELTDKGRQALADSKAFSNGH